MIKTYNSLTEGHLVCQLHVVNDELTKLHYGQREVGLGNGGTVERH